MTARFFAAVLTGQAGVSASVLGWPSGQVSHHFHDTEYGQIHYVTSGDLSKTPMVYLHAHPRSSAEFKYVHAEMDGAVPFLAVDWFGFGQSEDYRGSSEDDFITFEGFSTLALDILDKHSIDQFSVVGWMKGAHPAIELAAQAGPERLHKLALMGALILSPDAQSYVINNIVPNSKHPILKEDGSHLIDTWNDPSGAEAQLPEELLWNQEKTNDALRCLYTNWQYQAAWGDYNPKIQARLSYVDSFAKTLVINPTIAIAKWDMYGLNPGFSLDAFDQTMVHGNNVTINLAASEGGLKQNSTIIANTLKDFLAEKHAVVV